MPATAAEQAYPKTPVGEMEIKTLPAATLLLSRSDKGYFEEDNALFRPLFRYIQKRDIPMTTPVEAGMEPGEMFFYVGEGFERTELELEFVVFFPVGEEREFHPSFRSMASRNTKSRNPIVADRRFPSRYVCHE